MDELLDDLHASIQLVEGQDVLLGEETQSGTLSKILSGKREERTGGLHQKGKRFKSRFS